VKACRERREAGAAMGVGLSDEHTLLPDLGESLREESIGVN
jgi:hypothetical protein